MSISRGLLRLRRYSDASDCDHSENGACPNVEVPRSELRMQTHRTASARKTCSTPPFLPRWLKSKEKQRSETSLSSPLLCMAYALAITMDATQSTAPPSE